MKEIIYLTVSQQGVQSMRKSFTGSKKGEIVVKLNVQIAQEAFSPPVIEQFIQVNDWKDGVDIEDVKFEQNFITVEESQLIKQKRLEKMKDILESQGYEVSKSDES